MRDFFLYNSWAIAVKIAFCIIAYLLGAVNFATLISRARGGDVRRAGSGNPGTMNMLRVFGKGWGALTFILDCLKGVLCALLGRFIVGSAEWMFILGGIAVLGHVFPVYTRFKGGKGVATAIGMYLVADPIVAPIVLAALVLILLFLKYGFLGSLAAITALSVYSAVKYRGYWIIITVNVLLLLLIIFTHRGNIARLIKGKENTLKPGGRREDSKGQNADALGAEAECCGKDKIDKIAHGGNERAADENKE